MTEEGANQRWNTRSIRPTLISSLSIFHLDLIDTLGLSFKALINVLRALQVEIALLRVVELF